MRLIGAAERGLSSLLLRVSDPARKTFGKPLYSHGTIMNDIAQSRCDIESARYLVLTAAEKMDRVGNKQALKEIAIAKTIVPKLVCGVLDRAIQAWGGGGVEGNLAVLYAHARTLRIADGSYELNEYY